MVKGDNAALWAGGAVLLALAFANRKKIGKAAAQAVTTISNTATAWRGGKPIGLITLKSVGTNSAGKPVYLEANRADSFLAMQTAALTEGIQILPESGFRSFEEQTVLYAANQLKDIPTAKPGFSNHQSGDAIDIVVPPQGTAPNDPRRLESRVYRWMIEHGPSFGFRNDIQATKEAWHFSNTGR